ncbi:MAG: hypothetical protein KDB27_07870 [Planctomycetales bacterium]|nr:hypothetical protein [Planctomycetales bacterium]
MRLAAFTLFLSLSIAALSTHANAQATFNGIELDQTFNRHDSPAFGTHWFIDLEDNFSEPTRAADLSGSLVDTISMGFVLPAGDDLTNAGRWMPSTDYFVDSSNGGSISRQAATSIEVTCIPWRITPELGDLYLIEMTSAIAEGELIRLGYFGNVNELGTDQGLTGDLAQLVLEVRRGEGATANEYSWTIDSPMLSSAVSDSFTLTPESDLRLQLGWNENTAEFDAWIESVEGENHLATGDLEGDLDVFGIGLELTGTGSTVSNFIAAVPEPANISIVITALISIAVFRRKR